MSRPLIAVVTSHWGAERDEATTITRLLAGALARAGRVEVLHVGAPVAAPTTRRDSAFSLHEIPVRGNPRRAALVRAALTRDGGGLSPTLEQLVAAEAGSADGVAERLAALAPDAVVLAGHEQRWAHGALSPGGSPVTFVPILGEHGRVAERGIALLVAGATRIATVNPGEHAAFERAFPGRRDDLVALDPALPVNRPATAQMLFGVHWFGTYVLLIRAFPPATPRYARLVTRELLSSLLGVSVAEVDGERFTISDRDNAVELPVNPTRINLWRLMAHAEVTIDARPPGPFGQEAIESMLLGTPVVVPAGSAAHAAVEEASGGLGYRGPGELVDAARALLRPGAGEAAGAAGQRWSERHYGDAARFVEHATEIVLGAAHRPAPSSAAASPSRMSDSE